jgi:glutaminyl-tRNA synthetase
LGNASADSRYQFLRKGYFCLDKDATKEKLIFNRTVTLKDAWGKEVKKN